MLGDKQHIFGAFFHLDHPVIKKTNKIADISAYQILDQCFETIDRTVINMLSIIPRAGINMCELIDEAMPSRLRIVF